MCSYLKTPTKPFLFCSEKQYKTQLKKWNLDTKYIKASEYMAMIRTRRQRESENPPKQTRFMLRGRPVDPKDITRFEKRALKKGMMKEEDLMYDDQGKASALPCPGLLTNENRTCRGPGLGHTITGTNGIRSV